MTGLSFRRLPALNCVCIEKFTSVKARNKTFVVVVLVFDRLATPVLEHSPTWSWHFSWKKHVQFYGKVDVFQA